MKVILLKEDLLPVIEKIVSVAGIKSETVINNFLLRSDGDTLSVTSTDKQIEMRAEIGLNIKGQEEGSSTVPARKFFDIIKGFDEGSRVTLRIEKEKCIVKSGRRRLSLATLPVETFPLTQGLKDAVELRVDEVVLHQGIRSVAFSMANEDVRYYLNGVLLQIVDGVLTLVGTNSYRLSKFEQEVDCDQDVKVIIPRNSVLQMQKLLGTDEGDVELRITSNQLQMMVKGVQLTTKLIDGKYPDFESIIPELTDNIASIDCKVLASALRNSAILADKVHNIVRMKFEPNLLTLSSSNDMQENAEDSIDIGYEGEDLTVDFNLGYILDILGNSSSACVEFSLKPDSFLLVNNPEDNRCTYIVAPTRA